MSNNIFDLFKKTPATSADLNKAASAIAAHLQDTEVKLEQIEATRRQLLLTEGAESHLAKINLQRSALRDEMDRSVLMIEDLRARAAKAAAAENERALDARGVALRKKNLELRDLYLQLDAEIIKLIAGIENGQRMMREIAEENKFLIENGRDDLRVQNPLGLLCIKLGRSVGSLPDPLNVFRGGGYAPARHPDHSLLAGLRELDL